MAIDEVGYTVAYAVLFAATSLFCIVRFYLDIDRYRHIRSKANLASLFSYFVGWVFFVVTAGCNFWIINKNLQVTQHGRKAIYYVAIAGVDLPDIEKTQILSNVVSGFALITRLWAVKVSFFLMNLKLVPHLSEKLKYALIVLAIYLFLTFLGNLLVIALSCRPISKMWKMTSILAVKEGACVPTISHSAIGLYTAFNISSDLFVMALPILILRDLRLNRRDKCGVAFLLFLGICMISATATRSVLMVQLGDQLRANPETVSPSLSRATEILGYLEISVALVAGSLPSMRSKLRRMNETKAQKRPKRKDGIRTIGGSGNHTVSYEVHGDMEMAGESDDSQKLVLQQPDHSIMFLTTHEPKE